MGGMLHFHHEIRLEVRWGDMDAYGHVNNSLFFRYLESGRFAYIQDIFPPLVAETIPVIVLADIQCRFEAQIVFPAEIVVKTKVVRLGNSSFDIYAELWHGVKRCAKSKAVMVWLDQKTSKPIPIPEMFVEKIRALEGL